MNINKRILSFFLAALMILSPMANLVLAVEDNIELEEKLEHEKSIEDGKQTIFSAKEEDVKTPFKYTEEDGVVTITGYDNDSPVENLVIPKNIGGKPVEKIGNQAFRKTSFGGIKTTIKTLDLPEGLKEIGREAFQGHKIKEIFLPKSLEKINHRAFYNNEIEKIIFSENIEYLGSDHFGNNNLEELAVPGYLKNISSEMFGRCNISKLILEDGIESIGAKAFHYSNIEEVIIPDTVKEWPKSGAANPIFRMNKINDRLIFVRVFNNSGATEGNTFGIVNPTRVTIKYLDNQGNELKKPDVVVGKELKSLEEYGEGYSKNLRLIDGSNEYIRDYFAPINDYKVGDLIDELSHNYYRQGKEYIFEAPEINGIKPESQIVKLEDKEETIVFTYGEEKEEENNDDEERVDNALKSIEWYKFNLDSDIDKNIVGVLQSELDKKGFDDVKVSLKSSEDEEYIDNNGNISYYFEDPKTMNLSQTISIVCEFELSKGKVKKVWQKNVPIGWDKPRVREIIKKDIYPLIDEDIIKDKNIDLNSVKENLILPKYLDSPNRYVSINWKSSDESVLTISDELQQGGSENFYKPFIGEVKRGLDDRKVKLTAYINFNHGKDQNEVTMIREYDVNILGLREVGNLDEMQKELDENYKIEKLRDSVTKKVIDKDNIVNDIQLLTPGKTGIKNYDNYRFTASTRSENLEVNGYRVKVYRPLPGEEAREETITIWMKDKHSDLSVSKDISFMVQPLTEEEIDREIELMELAKENYFNGIKGDNRNKDEIINNLHSFQEINLEDGKLVYTYNIKDSKNTGIIPADLDGAEDQEQWRLFRSSNPSVIKHENLVVYRPDEDTKVKIDSILSSKLYERYAEKYPQNKKFKKLYRQPVEIELTVLGKNSIPAKTNLDDEIEFMKEVYKVKFTKRAESNPLISKQGPGAAKLAGLDIKDIQESIYIDDKNDSAYQLAQSILTLIGADMDPRQYNDKGNIRNLVKELEELQLETGEFVGKGKDYEKRSLISQVRAIIALDMAAGKYDKEKAVARLLDIYNARGEEGIINNKEIEAEGLTLIALSNHRDKDNVEENIQKMLEFLKSKQNPQGGFDMRNASAKGTNTPLAIGRVIQGLVANGIDPLTDKEWIKNGNTMLDAMIRSKISNKDDMRFNGYSRGEEEKNSYGDATDLAFGALMDLKNQESMFDLLSLNKEDIEPKKIIINDKENLKELKEGTNIGISANIYDKNNKLISGEDIIWETSDSDIAEVVDGRLILKSSGNFELIARVEDYDISDKVEIIVKEEIKELEVEISIITVNKDNTWEIDTNPKKTIINKDKHDGGFTAYGALQSITDVYDVSSDGWIKSINNKTPGKDGSWMYSVNGKDPEVMITQAVLKEGDRVLVYCLEDWKAIKTIPSWKEIVKKAGLDTTDSSMEIKILNKLDSIYIDEDIKLEYEITKENELVEKDIVWTSSNKDIADIENGRLIIKKPGKVFITVSLKDNENIKDTIELNIVDKVSENTVDKVVNDMRSKYSKKENFTFREAIGYNHSSYNLEKDLNIIQDKIKMKDNNSTTNVAGNIIGLVAAGEDPYDYNNINYVEILEKSQKANDKFLIGEYDDFVTSQAFAIIALDMAGVKYNSKTIDMLLEYQNEDGSFSSFEGDIDSVGMVLTALGNHMDHKGVKESVDMALEYISNNWKGANQYSLSAVIQGLIAIDEDLNNERWRDGNTTIVDRLLSFYKNNVFGNESADEQAFIALADVLKGKSMFKEIRFNGKEASKIEIKDSDRKLIEGDFIDLYITARDKDGNITITPEIEWSVSDKDIASIDKTGRLTGIKPGKVKVTAKVKDSDIKAELEVEVGLRKFEIEYIGDDNIINGKTLEAKVKITNNTDKSESAMLIIGLYDKNNRLINYSIVNKEIEAKELVEVGAGFLVPDIGEYHSKAFVWDGLEMQNIIMEDAKEIKIAN